MLSDFGLTWFNPDTYSRALLAQNPTNKDQADADAWAYGKAQLEAAIATRTNYAFETTLGGNTIPRLLAQAARTHDVIMIYCGLASPEMHIDRVRQRVQQGGHDIPVEKIRERWISSRDNVIRLMPLVTSLRVFDNSTEALPGQDVPYPLLVLKIESGEIIHPNRLDITAVASTPEWAKPIVAAAFQYEDNSHDSPES